MSALERELRDLGRSLEWPETPDFAGRITTSITTSAPPRPRRRRVALAVAVACAAILAVLAVPPARTAVLEWLGIGATRISVVEELPPVPTTPMLELLGEPATLETARRRAGFRFAEPPRDEPAPDEIRLDPGRRVSFVWRDGRGFTLLVTQFPGTVDDPAAVKKIVAGTTIEHFRIDGDEAIWLVGGPHVVLFVAPDGNLDVDSGWLAGNTLLVDRSGVTVRVEGALTRDEATTLVRAMHP